MTGGQFIYSESVKVVSEVVLMPKNAIGQLHDDDI